MDIFNRPPTISDDTLQYTLYPPPSLRTNFIWHKDSFELKAVSDPGVANRWLLEGRMRVGDCVDDEWCVVWLFKEISAKWDLAISRRPAEMGNPRQLRKQGAPPSLSMVWIYGSRLHLIPLSHISPPSRPRKRRRSHDSDDEGTAGIAGNDDGGWIAVEDALKLIFDRNVNTLAPPEVERLVWKRISGLPLTRPTGCTQNEPLPSRILGAHFGENDSNGICPAGGTKIYPPKIFGRWSEKEGTPERRWREVGMKLVEAYKSELNGSGAYKKYIDNLKNSTYFRGEAEGSVLWKELEKKAADIYVMTLRVERITAEDQLANEQAVKLRSLASKVEEFVEGQGDLEGARFADEASDDEEFSDGMPSTDSGDSDDESDINISDRNDKVRDTDNREDAAHRQAAMDNLIPGSFLRNTEKCQHPFTATRRGSRGHRMMEIQREIRTHGCCRADAGRQADDSDDETDEEEEEEDEEDQPQLVGDIEVDMGEEEEEFLEFARQTLGINDEQWESIIKDRTDRGDDPQTVKEGNGRTSTSEQRPNSKLDSFDAVMQALDAELSRSSNKSTALPPRQHTAADKGKGKEHTEFSPASGLDKILEGAGSEYENEDIEKAMEAELKAALEKEGDGEGDNDFDGDGGMDYNLIKNFLESFKSQAGSRALWGTSRGDYSMGGCPGTSIVNLFRCNEYNIFPI
ncbi:SGT1 protein [Salix suchowensis]|nr:SGT1 protein [Salix suchowensis]